MRLSLLCIAFAPALLFGQSDPASLQGKVIDIATGQGVRKATVILHSNSGQNYATVTGPLGEFRFDNLPAGSGVAVAEADGYSALRSGNVKGFTVSAGEHLTGLEIALAPLGVITGRVVDEEGEPLDGVSIAVTTYVYNSLRRTLQQVSVGSTDDRGIYRIFDLQPGRYYVSAELRQPPAPANSAHVHRLFPEEGYARVFHPSAADITQASPHNLKPGEQWAGADFKLHKQPTYHIRGRVDPGAQVMRGGGPMIEIAQCNSEPVFGGGAQNRAGGQDGSFDISGLVAGTYCLMLREPTRGAIALRQRVTVKDADVDGVALTPETPFNIKGSVVFEGAPPSDNLHLGISLSSPDGFQQAQANLSADLTFNLDNIFPGRYFLQLPEWTQWYVKSIVYGGQDVSSGVIADAEPGAALTIFMGSDPGEIDGAVQSETLTAFSPVTIAVLPDEAHIERSDLYRIISVGKGGRFSIHGLAPGDYRVFALEGQMYNEAHNPALLKLLESRASVVTVHANGHEQVSLTPIAAGEVERAEEKLQ